MSQLGVSDGLVQGVLQGSLDPAARASELGVDPGRGSRISAAAMAGVDFLAAPPVSSVASEAFVGAGHVSHETVDHVVNVPLVQAKEVAEQVHVPLTVQAQPIVNQQAVVAESGPAVSCGSYGAFRTDGSTCPSSDVPELLSDSHTPGENVTPRPSSGITTPSCLFSPSRAEAACKAEVFLLNGDDLALQLLSGDVVTPSQLDDAKAEQAMQAQLVDLRAEFKAELQTRAAEVGDLSRQVLDLRQQLQRHDLARAQSFKRLSCEFHSETALHGETIDRLTQRCVRVSAQISGLKTTVDAHCVALTELQERATEPEGSVGGLAEVNADLADIREQLGLPTRTGALPQEPNFGCYPAFL